VRTHRRLQVVAPYWMGAVPRYTYRRLTKLPSTADELRRHTVLNLPGMLHGLSFEHMVMRPHAAAPISVDDDTGVLIFTIAGRGVMLLDGDRIEVAANDLVHIPAGVPYGLQTLGGSDWVYVVLQAPVG
jgi:mannose-6-phosphate isomerase-like protein (cupin superfamily)